MSTDLKLYRGIKGLEPRRGPTVVIANGRKNPVKGEAPVLERDRFHIVDVHCNKNGIRPYHSAYADFNNAPPEKRRTLYGILVHQFSSDAFWHQRVAQQLPVAYYEKFGWFKRARPDQQTVAHPNGNPCCSGNGIRARRWVGPEPNSYEDMPCPGRECEFSIKTGKGRPPCGPKMAFTFQLRWDSEFKHLPPALARYDCKGWDTIANFLGFFDDIRLAVEALRIPDAVLYGFPFIMSIAEKTKPSEKWLWPVISISAAINPLDFFGRQRDQIRQISAGLPARTIAEEMQLTPSVYLMDEISAKPIRIGAPENPAPLVIDAEVSEVNESLFPDNWGANKKYRTVSVVDLKKLLDTNQKQDAIYEMFFRVAAFETHFQGAGEKEFWLTATGDGDVRNIPLAELSGVVTKLTDRWAKIKPNKKAA